MKNAVRTCSRAAKVPARRLRLWLVGCCVALFFSECIRAALWGKADPSAYGPKCLPAVFMWKCHNAANCMTEANVATL
jgi:hypothetical protein